MTKLSRGDDTHIPIVSDIRLTYLKLVEIMDLL